ncbi:HepT-like ribonuclease domain-containing protein [Synechococcus sp. Nb3U1]
MSDFRDVLIHSCLQVDFEQVWAVVAQEIPSLKPKLKSKLIVIHPFQC